MKNNALYLLFVLAVACILITSCKNSESDSKTKKNNQTANVEDFIAVIPELENITVNDMYLYNNHAYLVSDKSCTIFDLTTKEAVQHPFGGSAICVDADYIYISTTETCSLTLYSAQDFSAVKTAALDIPQNAVERICRMLPMKQSILFEVSYLNDAEFSESHIFEYHLDKQTVTDHTAYFKGNDSYALVKSMDAKDENTIVFVTIANMSFANTIFKSYTYNLKTQTVQNEFIFDFTPSYSAYDALSNSYIYSEDSYTLKRYQPDSDEKTLLTALTKEEIGESSHIDSFLLSGGSIFIFKNSANLLCAADINAEKNSLHILAYESIWDFDLQTVVEQFEKQYQTNVTITYYDSSVLKDRLRTKLLFQGDDFDIVFVDNPTEENFLSSVINYKLFAPLNEKKEITANFEKMYSGVSEMLSADGAIIGVPYHIEINSLIKCNDMSPLKQPLDFRPSFSTVWELCEQFAQEENYVVFSDSYHINPWILRMIQDQINASALDQKALANFLTTVKTYYDRGVLFGSDLNFYPKSSRTPLLSGMNDIFSTMITSSLPYESPESGIFCDPSEQITHVVLHGLAMINRYAANIDLAYDFIAFMTEEEFLYSTNMSGGIYRFTLLGNQPEKNTIYSSLSPDKRALFSVLPQLFENACIFTYDYTLLSAYILDNLLEDFYSGKLSPDDMAKNIITFVEYTYFE